jgi:hypothetical protein
MNGCGIPSRLEVRASNRGINGQRDLFLQGWGYPL